MAVPADATLDVDVPSVSFVVDADPALLGAEWTLTGFDKDTESQPITLATGVVTATAAAITITVPLADLAPVASAFFEWSAFRRLSDSHGLLSIRGGGLAPWELVADAVVDLGTATANTVPINAAADAVPTMAVGTDGNTARSPWPSDTTTPVNPEEPIYGLTPAKPSATSVPQPEATDPQTNTLGPQVPNILAQCPYNPKCIDPENPYPHKPDQGAGLNCTFEGGATKRCLVDDELYPMVTALRGFSQRPVGARTTFSVESEVSVEWDLGVRYEAGPFSASGTVNRGKTGGTSDTWPLRGDCWGSGRPGDDIGRCDGRGGSRAATGTDTWVWERWLRESCPYGPNSCSRYYWENLRQKAWGGGTDSGEAENLYYYEQPSAIKAGMYGVVGRYLPDARTRRFTLESRRTYIGATLAIEPGGSWGSGTFNAGTTNKTLTKVVNSVQFRDDLPWMHAWYRYDSGMDPEPWEREFFSCELEPGWSQGTQPCWSYGS